MPPPSEAVLVVGVIAIIMTICDMRFWNKAIWLVLVFAFASLEIKSITKDRLEANDRETTLYILAKGTAEKTDRTLNSVGVLGIQLSSLPGQIQDAKKHNDLELAAQLEKQQEETQKRFAFALAHSRVLSGGDVKILEDNLRSILPNRVPIQVLYIAGEDYAYGLANQLVKTVLPGAGWTVIDHDAKPFYPPTGVTSLPSGITVSSNGMGSSDRVNGAIQEAFRSVGIAPFRASEPRNSSDGIPIQIKVWSQ